MLNTFTTIKIIFVIILVYFRAIPVNTELKAFDNPVDVYILDPNRHIMRRWLSRQVCIY